MNEFLERYETLGETFDPKKIIISQSLRINTIKIDDKALIQRLNASLDKIPFLEHGYFFESAFTVGAMPEHFLGYIYIQEAASQLPPEVLDPKPGDVVLDMCASPGSKTTQMAAMMKNQGVIIALDANNARLPALKNNLERCGVENCAVYKKDASYAKDLKLMFDKILLDAPCSGNFTQEKDWFSKRNLNEINEVVKLQRKLISEAIDILKPNGVLVYSTCSLEPEENELNMHWMLENFDNVTLEKIDKKTGEPGLVDVFGKKLNPEIKKCLRLWPHKHGTQGFFVARIKKVK